MLAVALLLCNFWLLLYDDLSVVVFFGAQFSRCHEFLFFASCPGMHACLSFIYLVFPLRHHLASILFPLFQCVRLIALNQKKNDLIL
jgi:hypothetical protein